MSTGAGVEVQVALLHGGEGVVDKGPDSEDLARRTWVESKKLWRIVGPAILNRVSAATMNAITHAFAGHLGDLELASMSIANSVVVGFNFGLMLGMASALETLCGQAFGAKKLPMLGVYMQRSWIVLILCATLMLPMYFFATPLLVLLGQPPELAEQAGTVSLWFIPLHFSFAFLFPLQRFLQCQLKNSINAVVAAIALAVHVLVTWLFVFKLKLGLIGITVTLNFSWWASVICLYLYVTCGGCTDTWKGFSGEAFSGLWDFVKLSAASGVMLCLENWYYRILIVLSGNLEEGEVALDAISICMSINGWELMIPLAFFAGTGVRVANELGAGNGKAARFATIVSVANSSLIGFFFGVLLMALHDKFALIYSSSPTVLQAVDDMSILLAFTIVLNSVQPVLSGVAVGSGWQAMVAYINIGTYYLIGLPVGLAMCWLFKLGVAGIWAGMIGGTAVQTVILAAITIRCDWDKEALMARARMEEEDLLK
ncbi:protein DETOXIFICATION 27-like [Curcuma longa]|uniref:protein DETOXIFICATION 27-like n=1 Tax=Curcuma longa TaxID=136217 RepID=UPI003D9EE4A4